MKKQVNTKMKLQKWKKIEKILLQLLLNLGSINGLNQRGRERLLDAFDKVSRKFNEVYTKLLMVVMQNLN